MGSLTNVHVPIESSKMHVGNGNDGEAKFGNRPTEFKRISDCIYLWHDCEPRAALLTSTHHHHTQHYNNASDSSITTIEMLE